MAQSAIAGEVSFSPTCETVSPRRLFPMQPLHGRLSASAGYGPHARASHTLPAAGRLGTGSP